MDLHAQNRGKALKRSRFKRLRASVRREPLVSLFGEGHFSVLDFSEYTNCRAMVADKTAEVLVGMHL